MERRIRSAVTAQNQRMVAADDSSFVYPESYNYNKNNHKQKKQHVVPTYPQDCGGPVDLDETVDYDQVHLLGSTTTPTSQPQVVLMHSTTSPQRTFTTHSPNFNTRRREYSGGPVDLDETVHDDTTATSISDVALTEEYLASQNIEAAMLEDDYDYYNTGNNRFVTGSISSFSDDGNDHDENLYDFNHYYDVDHPQRENNKYSTTGAEEPLYLDQDETVLLWNEEEDNDDQEPHNFQHPHPLSASPGRYHPPPPVASTFAATAGGKQKQKPPPSPAGSSRSNRSKISIARLTCTELERHNLQVEQQLQQQQQHRRQGSNASSLSVPLSATQDSFLEWKLQTQAAASAAAGGGGSIRSGSRTSPNHQLHKSKGTMNNAPVRSPRPPPPRSPSTCSFQQRRRQSPLASSVQNEHETSTPAAEHHQEEQEYNHHDYDYRNDPCDGSQASWQSSIQTTEEHAMPPRPPTPQPPRQQVHHHASSGAVGAGSSSQNASTASPWRRLISSVKAKKKQQRRRHSSSFLHHNASAEESASVLSLEQEFHNSATPTAGIPMESISIECHPMMTAVIPKATKNHRKEEEQDDNKAARQSPVELELVKTPMSHSTNTARSISSSAEEEKKEQEGIIISKPPVGNKPKKPTTMTALNHRSILQEQELERKWIQQQREEEQAKQQQHQQSNTKGQLVLSACVQCQGQTRSHIALPCLHFVLCAQCVVDASTCPVCDDGKAVSFSRVQFESSS